MCRVYHDTSDDEPYRHQSLLLHRVVESQNSGHRVAHSMTANGIMPFVAPISMGAFYPVQRVAHLKA